MKTAPPCPAPARERREGVLDLLDACSHPGLQELEGETIASANETGRRSVTLLEHDPSWLVLAAEESNRILGALAGVLLRVHHIGSTAIRGLIAKPVVDLLGEAADLRALDARSSELEALGYRARGENGLAGRRYFTRDDPRTGERWIHLHCYQAAEPAVRRHIAFRDHLRNNPALAVEYGRVKALCIAAAESDSRTYSCCKAAWIRRIEADALGCGDV